MQGRPGVDDGPVLGPDDPAHRLLVGVCAFKYLWRWPLKGGLEDLEKCRECLGNLIECAKGGVE